MTTTPVRRAPRVAAESPPRQDIVLQMPPVMPKPQSGMGGSAPQMVMYLPMMLGMGAMMFVGAGSGGAMSIAFGGLMGVSMVGMLVFGVGQARLARKAGMNDERGDYLRYLDTVRRKVHRIADQQRRAMLVVHPDPPDLLALAVGPRVWERRRSHPDFGQVRVAVGPQLLASRLTAPADPPPFEDLDPVCLSALRQFLRTYATVPDLPIAISMRAYPRICVVGERAAVLDAVRAALAQLVTLHGPQDLRVAVCAAPERLAEWDWLKWLPHNQHRSDQDACGTLRLATDDPAELEALLDAEVQGRSRFSRGAVDAELPHLVLLRDGSVGAGAAVLAEPIGLAGTTVIDIGSGDPGPAGMALVVTDGQFGVLTGEGILDMGRPDRLDRTSAEVMARSLAAYPRSAGVDATPEEPDDALARTLTLPNLLAIADPRAVNLPALWAKRSGRSRLRIPIGLDTAGRLVDLDLKESAEEGMGPHGLLIGATGSGKSELLRTLVLGLGLTHSSENLNLVLIDFKGGATFAGLSRLPHTAAVITNLADDASMVDRMRDAINGELVRRQELLRSAGNYASVRDYERAREAGAPLSPLPTLIVIIDEFSELLTAQPDMVDLFVMIGRLGRSLGVHLLLASQRLDEGRLRGLDSHLSYRIALRTFSSSESRSVIGVPDAGDLPPIPGSGFLRIDSSTLIRFKAAYVSGALPQPPAPPRVSESGAILVRSQLTPFALRNLPVAEVELTVEDVLRAAPAPPEPDDPLAESTMDVLVRQLEGAGPPPHRLWLPPLAAPPTLDRLLPGIGAGGGDRIVSTWPGPGQLVAPVGIVDRPFEQRQETLCVDLREAAGHAVIVGGPRSGKSTLLRTMITSFALTHSPADVQFYCLDFGGGSLTASLAGLPHVGGVAGRLDAERVSRVVAEVATALDVREQTFRREGIDSIDTFRRRRAAGERLEERGLGDVFLVVDGYSTMREDFDLLHDVLVGIVTRGLAFGIHVVITANRWMEVRSQVRDLIGTRLELRLGDPFDSEMDRKAAAKVPADRPGRGITKEKLHWMAALPRIDGVDSAADLTTGVAGVVAAATAAWPGLRAPEVRLLPSSVGTDELPPGDPESPVSVPVGLSERTLGPVSFDFHTDAHLLVFGDVECGKTGLLRLIVRQLAAGCTPDQAAVLLIDHRRTLLGEFDPDYVRWYSGTESSTAELLEQTAGSMQARLPGADITPAQLRRRDWWSGPELFVVVDDHDLVVTQRNNPLEPLLPLLPHARDIGLHVVITRRSGGASRALYDPVMQRLLELGSPVLLMSGSPDEGALVANIKMRPQPPGRGLLIRRKDGAGLVQFAWTPPAEHE